MPINVLYAAADNRWADFRTALPAAFENAGLDVDLRRHFDDPAAVDYLVYAPNGPITDLSPYVGAKAVLSLWAGVEAIVEDPTLTQPLTRMVDDGLKEGMVEYVTGHVLRHHLGMDEHILGLDGDWRINPPPLARKRRVGILGLGALGRASAEALAALNFPVMGWSRSAKSVDGIETRHGEAGLEEVLRASDILVLLLPLTPETENLLTAERLEMLPKGAFVINPARGPMIDDGALIAALDAGHLAHATLDVFRVEPLPRDHPFWAHPKVTVTPHIASETREDTASAVIAENIRRGEAGEQFLYLVDRKAGY